MARPRVHHKGTLIEGFLRERQKATARDVAQGLQLSVQDASRELYRLRVAGTVHEIERVSVEYAKRPVALYQVAEPFERSAIFDDAWLR
jgi:predicted ArsR family transcriptional regulator